MRVSSTIKVKLLLGVMALAPLDAAWAQDAAPADDEAGAIVVTAARTALPANALPLTIEVIAKDSLDQQIAISGSVNDAVATLTPSFSPTRQKLSGAGETLRGRSPLYAINGIPQSTPLRDGSRDAFTIDGFFVDRVELIYGSNALQGIGGTGGIVNQVTVGAPKEEGISGRTLLQASADNGFSGDGIGWKAGGLLQYRAGDFDATLGAVYEKRGVYYDGQGHRAGLNLTQGETQDSKTTNFFVRLGYAVTPTGRLDLIASRFELKSDGDYVAVPGVRRPYQSQLSDVPTTAARGTAPGVPAAGRTESVALSYTDSDFLGGMFTGQVFFNRSRDTFGGENRDASGRYIASFQDPTLAPIGDLFDQSQNRSRKIGAKFSYERTVLDALTVTIGFDALWDRTEQRLIATNRVWVPPADFRSLAPFAQANLKLFDGKLRLAGGARWENVQVKIDDFHTLAQTTSTRRVGPFYGGVDVAGGKPSFDDLLVNGGVILEPWQGIRAYASYAEGFTMPDVGRITRSINEFNVDIDTYLAIEPIVSNNREIGVEVKRGPVDASASYFWSSSKKGQLLVPGTERNFDVQRQRVEIEGLELNLKVAMPIDGLKLGVGYAHILGRFDSNADGKVDSDLDGVNISPDRVNLSLNYDRGPLSLLVQHQVYLKRRFDSLARAADDVNPLHPARLANNDFGGYSLTDASIRYRTALGTFNLSLQNLFDKFYIDYSSDTRLPTDTLAIFAGRGRSFTLGWDYRF